MKNILALAFVVLVTPSVFSQTFRADDPVLVDNDTAIDVKSITPHKLSDYYDFIQHTFGKPGDRTPVRALNVNTLGEVPDSSWFQNRHPAKRMPVEDLVRGPNTGSGPSMEQPWVVIGAKTEGITPGFRIRDSRGDVYIIKFDPPENPELATAAEIISTKFFYALGYKVPENYLVTFKREQLRADSKAMIGDTGTRQRRLTESELNSVLRRVRSSPDGMYRALASKLLQGTPLGPFQYHGTRPDDPNDIFPHEHRRELRGLRVFAAWLNHDDSRAINSLDMLVEDKGHRHVRHYLIDFGATLGSGTLGAQTPRAGWEYMWEPSAVFKRIVTLGMWDKEWVWVRYPSYSSIGRFEGARFEPQNWRPEYPNPAFMNATDEDTYWAAKAVMAFSDDDIRAIVKTGQLSNAEAEEYLVRTLMARRDKIGQYWLSRVSSFDHFSVVEGQLQFEHIASQFAFVPRPDHGLSWFAVDPATGTRERMDVQQCPKAEGYFQAEIASVR